MGLGDRAGYARVNPRDPRAFAVCDFCGRWFNHVDLVEDRQYFGNAIQWTGYLVCRQCNDLPQAQLQPIHLPPDPMPIRMPRPEFFEGDRSTFGFIPITVLPPVTPDGTDAAQLAALQAIIAIANEYPTNAEEYGSAVATGAEIPVTYSTFAVDLLQPNVATALVPAPSKPPRQFLCVYNPTAAPVVVSKGQAAFAGDPLAMLLGPGNALLMVGPSCYQGALTCCCQVAPAPVWAWADGVAAGGLFQPGTALFPVINP